MRICRISYKKYRLQIIFSIFFNQNRNKQRTLRKNNL